MFILYTYLNYDINRKALVMDATQVHNVQDYIQYCTYLQLDLLDVPSVRKRTPLLIAVELNNIEFVKHIILLGGNVDIVSGREYLSPLCYAVKYHKNDIARVLIDSGANLNNSHYMLPILMAVMYNTEMIAPLIEAGCDVDLECGPIEMTPLMYATKTENLVAVQILVEHGSDANKCCGISQNCPLVKAVMLDNVDIVNALLEHGANPNTVNMTSIQTHTTPLISCIQNNNFDILTLLVQNGADVNMSNQHGTTPLSCLVRLVWISITSQSFRQSEQSLLDTDESVQHSNDTTQLTLYIKMLKSLFDAGLKKAMIDRKQLMCCSLYCPSFVALLKHYRGRDCASFHVVRHQSPFDLLDNNCTETIADFLGSKLLSKYTF